MSFITDFSRIDRSAPWLRPYADIHSAFAADMPKLPLYQWLNGYFAHHHISLTNGHGTPAVFTHQNELEHGTAYEIHIGRTATIPTRDNLHDWFGACAWSVFPKTKALLNAKHLSHISDDDSANKRNRVRDTITVFDENGVVLVVCDDDVGHDISTALTDFDWQTCLIKHRCYWYNPNNTDDVINKNHHNKAKVFIFGHALLEQLINPYKSLCSHTFIIKVNPLFFDLPIDKQLALLDNTLSIEMDKFLIDTVTPRQLNPLPILGVPYFWQNDNPQFYNDPFVFRSGRTNK